MVQKAAADLEEFGARLGAADGVEKHRSVRSQPFPNEIEEEFETLGLKSFGESRHGIRLPELFDVGQ